jgi:hypothetical protein
MLVAIRCYTLHCVEILPYCLSECAGAGAVEYPHFVLVKLYGIVDKVGHCLNGLVGTHAPHIDFPFELKLALA